MFGWKHQQNSHQANTEFSRTRLEMNDSQLKEFVWYLWTRGCFMFKSNLFKYVALVKWAGNNRTFYEMRNPTWSELAGRQERWRKFMGWLYVVSFILRLTLYQGKIILLVISKEYQRWMIFTMIKPLWSQYVRFEGKLGFISRSWNKNMKQKLTTDKLLQDWI